MRREKLGRLYYVFPGGRQENGETGEQDRSRRHARRGDLGASGMKLALDLLKLVRFDDRGNR